MTTTKPHDRPQIPPGIPDGIRALLAGGMEAEAVIERLTRLVEVIDGEIEDELRRERVKRALEEDEGEEEIAN